MSMIGNESVGLMGLTREMIKSGKDYRVLNFHLEDITHHLQKIIDQHPGIPIVVKIDCEGSEYEIMERLTNSSMIEKVTLFIIEWHNGLVKDLVASFASSPFILYTRTLTFRIMGILLGRTDRKNLVVNYTS